MVISVLTIIQSPEFDNFLYNILQISLAIFIILNFSALGQHKVTFRLITLPLDDSLNVCITGSTDALGNWDPNDVPMTAINDTTWEKSVLADKGAILEYKFTLGLWENEALDSTGTIPPNNTLTVENDTVITHTVYQWRKRFVDRKLFIDMSRFKRVSSVFFLAAPWYYSPHDSAVFANPGYDDNSWEELQTFLSKDQMPESGWNGSGWFRLHVYIDSTLQVEPLGLMTYAAGSLEIYLDGSLLYAFGDSTQLSDGITVEENFYPKDFTFGSGEEHLIAVRFVNDDIEHFHTANAVGGFMLYLYKMSYILDRMIPLFRENSFYQYFFPALALGFALLQLLLYFYLPRSRSNLIFALFLIFFAISLYFEFEQSFDFHLRFIIFDLRMMRIFQGASLLMLLLFMYSVFYEKIPKIFYVFAAGLTIIYAIATVTLDGGLKDYIAGTIVVIGIEEVRVIIRGFIRKTKGIWFIATGFLLLALSSVYDLLLDYQLIKPVIEIYAAHFIGLAGMIVIMSIYLARDIAFTNKRIIEQERLAEQQEAEKQILKERDETKNKLFSVIAHDLRSPFATLQMLTETLSDNYDRFREERRKEYVNNIYSLSSHIGNLIENLLNWSRTQLGRITITPIAFNLAELVESTFTLEETAARDKSITLQNNTPQDTTVKADRNTVQTILRNLTTNAIKFTGTGGSITVSAKENGPFIIISVADNGIGMTPEIREKLFKEAGTFTTRGTKSEKGTGLGLILCKEFVEKNGGKIWVESTPGEGSTFIFSLPKA